MRQIISTILASGLALGLTACQQKNDKTEVAPKAAVPNKLDFQKPTPGIPLTKIDARKIKAGLTIQSSMSLPPSSLVFPNTDTPAWQIKWEEEMLRRQDPTSYKMLKEIQANCSKSRPTLTFDVTVPANGGSVDNLRDGDHGKATATVGLSAAGNSACPLELSAGAGYGAEIQKIDQQDKSGSASAGMSLNTKAEVKNADYAQKLGVRGLELNTSLSAIAVVKNMKSGNLSLDFGYSGKLLTLSVDVPFDISVKALATSNDLEKGAQTEYVASMKLNYSGIAAELIVHAFQANDGKTTAEMYLNGYETTPEEIEKLFGKDTLQKIQTKNVTVIQTLK